MSDRFDTADLLNCYRRGVFPMADSRDDMRLFLMGTIMLLVMRFSPGGLLPERSRAS